MKFRQPLETGRLRSDFGARRRNEKEWAMAKPNPVEFLQEVQAEGKKVSWPTRKETMITTGMVFLLVIVASIFFLFADMIIRWGVGLVLGIGR